MFVATLCGIIGALLVFSGISDGWLLASSTKTKTIKTTINTHVHEGMEHNSQTNHNNKMMVESNNNQDIRLSHQHQQKQQHHQQRQFRILAFGDSLTAGTSGSNLFPYAPYLETALQSLRQQRNNDTDDNNTDTNSVMVRHRGMPGWTASDMLNDLDGPRTGLRSALQSIQDTSVSIIVIILVGTNDIGRRQRTEEQIVNDIIALHQICYEEGVTDTIAIAIPPSGYQSQVKDVADIVNRINNKLQEFCNNNTTTGSTNDHQHRRATFIPFPFQYERNGIYWYQDGLHFSKAGYQFLGESLAPVVNEILDTLVVVDDED
jgi:lysophospholipase L1-like esterase